MSDFHCVLVKLHLYNDVPDPLSPALAQTALDDNLLTQSSSSDAPKIIIIINTSYLCLYLVPTTSSSLRSKLCFFLARVNLMERCSKATLHGKDQ